MVDLFSYDDAVLYLRHVITANTNTRGFQSSLARASQCQLSYFSQFLHYKNNLSMDQALGISEFLHHGDLESEYFLNLIMISRAGTERLKQKLVAKNKALKERQESISGRFGNKPESNEKKVDYYTSWLYGAVHMALSIEKYGHPSALAKRFQTSERKIRLILSDLESMGFAQKKENSWELAQSDAHLPMDSKMTFLNHLNWRQRALFNIDRQTEKSLHYSSAFAIKLEEVPKFKKKILEFLEHLRADIQSSPAEEVYCFNLDFFEV